MINSHMLRVISNSIKPVPVIASTSAQSGGLTPGGGYTVSAPSGTASGDLLMMFRTIAGDVSMSLSSSGWNTAGDAYYKYAGSGETSYNFSSSVAGGEGFYTVHILRITGGIFTALGATSGASSSPVVMPSVTTTEANSLVLANMRNAAASTTFTLPSGFANVLNNSDATEPSTRLMSKVFPLGATGTVSVTSIGGGSTNYGSLYAIAPS